MFGVQCWWVLHLLTLELTVNTVCLSVCLSVCLTLSIYLSLWHDIAACADVSTWLMLIFHSFALTKLDILDDQPVVKIAMAYRVNGQTIDYYPSKFHVCLCVSQRCSVCDVICGGIMSTSNWGPEDLTVKNRKCWDLTCSLISLLNK